MWRVIVKFRLGYVAIALGLGQEYSTNRGTTYTHYQKLEDKEGIAKLELLTKINLDNLLEVLKYNVAHHIEVYRITSKLIPLATHPEVKNWEYRKTFSKELKAIGEYIKEHKLRISSHPDQFILLNSPREEVLQTSLLGLQYHYNVFDAMGIADQAVILLHIGGGYGDKPGALEQFYRGFSKVPEHIAKVLAFENDDKIYTAEETLRVCQKVNCPMVLDIHHYLCNNSGEDLQEYWPRIYETWKERRMVPKIHVSSPKEGPLDRRHADFIDKRQFMDFLKIAKNLDKNFDVMIEAKQKDLALFQLSKDLSEEMMITQINEGTLLF